MKILIACEESQAVCKAFREKGHEAYSCDILPCSGSHPEWHIKSAVLRVLDPGTFRLQNGDVVTVLNWDCIIAHPPCTYLSNSGVMWLYRQNGRWKKLKEGAKFFKTLLNAPVRFRAIENPIMHKHAIRLIGRKQDQVVQPYMFGRKEKKGTGFWLVGLPYLQPTDDVKAELQLLPKNQVQRIHYLPPSKDRAMLRSKTFPEIAEAMAQQWGNYMFKQLRGESGDSSHD